MNNITQEIEKAKHKALTQGHVDKNIEEEI